MRDAFWRRASGQLPSATAASSIAAATATAASSAAAIAAAATAAAATASSITSATAATASATAAVAAATATAVATAAATAIFAGPGFIYSQRPTFELLAVQTLDRGFRILIRPHLDEAKSLAAASFAILNHLRTGH